RCRRTIVARGATTTPSVGTRQRCRAATRVVVERRRGRRHRGRHANDPALATAGTTVRTRRRRTVTSGGDRTRLGRDRPRLLDRGTGDPRATGSRLAGVVVRLVTEPQSRRGGDSGHAAFLLAGGAVGVARARRLRDRTGNRAGRSRAVARTGLRHPVVRQDRARGGARRGGHAVTQPRATENRHLRGKQ